MRRRSLALGIAALGFAGSLACAKPAALPIGAALGDGGRRAPIVPDALDRAAADLAVAALAADPERVVRALGALEVSERRLRVRPDAQTPSGLVPAGLEAASAVLHPGREGRAATEALLARDDLDDAARARLERELADDPLVLARERLADARFVSAARLFNTFSEPIGRSALNATLLPYTLGRAVASYSLDLVEEEPLSLRRRQALAHWERFRRRHPDAPEVAELAPRVAAYQAKRRRTLHERAVARAEEALERGLPVEAVLYARRALRHEETAAARTLLARAEARLGEHRAELSRAVSFEAEPGVPASDEERAWVLATLSGSPLPEVPSSSGSSALAAEQRFLAATEAGRAGDADAMWRRLEALLEEGPGNPMARHAAALWLSPERHPFGAFERARRAECRRTALWLLLGPLAERPAGDAIGATRYVIDLPYRVQGAALLPVRLLFQWPWRGPTPGDVATAVHARRHLALHPDGAHAHRVRAWLVDFERERENHVGALRVAESGDLLDDAELDALRERAAEQAFRVASAEERRDLRAGLLTNVARSFPETRAGRAAGVALREQAEERGVHEIRLSRGFLLENPAVAGPSGLDLAPGLLDDEPRNGELHPEGVTLVGGREVVVAVLAPGGDEDDAPEKLRTRLAEEKLARLVARLEETSFRNALLDSDDALVADAARDALFERARLGLADAVDERPTAEARFVYRGMRERYGMVRSREALIPVELVVQGSLADLTLGAFPRLRPPRETPDAVLFR